MDIDDVYRQIGEFGRHQKVLVSCLVLQHAYAAFHMVHMVFIGAQPDVFFCKRGDKLYKDTCPSKDGNCSKYEFMENTFTSIATEFELVCSDGYKSSLVQSVFMAGVLGGAVIFGSLSDKYGRYKSLTTCVMCMTLFAFIGSFAQDFKSYIVLRFLTGHFCGGTILVSFVLASEVVGASKRALVGMLVPTVFALGIMLFSVLAYYIRTWRNLSVIVSLPGILCAATMWIIPESPRWLLGQGNLQEAERILEHIATRNTGRSSKKPILLRPLSQTSGETYSVVDLFNHSILRRRTIILSYAWFVNSGVYYGLTMSAGNMGGNRYISVALSALIELPAYALVLYILDRLGRRHTFCGFLVIGGLSCLGILAAPEGSAGIVTILALIGKLAISASFSIVYVYSAELYPTVIRNNGMGMCSMAARLGGIVAPIILPLDQVYPSLQFMVFGLMALTAGLWSFRLPETANMPMPETINDLEPHGYGVKVAPLSADKVRLLEGDIIEKQLERKALEEEMIS